MANIVAKSTCEMADIGELKTLIEEIQCDLATKATTEKIEQLILKIGEKDTKIAELEDKITTLENRVIESEKSKALLERKCDDLESYTRR